jgi:replicative DNA helicase
MIDPQNLYSASAEQAVLGCMLSQPAEVIDDVKSVFGDDKTYFFVPAHQEVYLAIISVYDQDGTVDTVTIDHWLRQKGIAQTVGSPGILGELLVGFASHLNVGSYVGIVREKKTLRDILEACSSTLKEAKELPDSVASLVDRALDKMNRVGDASFPRDITFQEAVLASSEEIVRHAQGGGGIRGLPTGFQRINQLTGGWKPGNLIIIGARPGVGKTALSLTFARALLRNQWNAELQDYCDDGFPGGMFSLEMTHDELCYRMLSAEGGIPLSDFHSGEVSEAERARLTKVAERIKHWQFHIETQRGSFMDITQLRARARRWKRKYGIRWLIVDFLQLVASREAKKRGRTEEVSDVARSLKQLSLELNIPVIALAQLNRSLEDGEPQLYHLKDSGAIEEAADLVFLLHELTEEVEFEGKVKKHILNLAKQRNGLAGIPATRIKLTYRAWCTLFTVEKD